MTSTPGSPIRTTVTVQGMTCQHCVRSVTEELTELPGVTDVAVDLQAGGDSPVTITSDRELDRALLAAAVQEAGYTLV